MIKLLTSVPIAVIAFAIAGNAQVPSRTPTFDPTRDGSPRAQLIYDHQMRQLEAERNSARFARLRQTSVIAQRPYSGTVFVGGYDSTLARQARNQILKDLPESSRYLELSKSSNSKLITLLPERECSATLDVKKKIDDIIRECPFYFLPGQARYYSFRQNDHAERKYADIGFTGDWVFSFGVFNQGIFVDLGDAAIERIGPDSLEMKGLRSVRPASDLETADREFKKFEDGVVIEEKVYRNTAKLDVGKTYGFRVIAYKTNFKEVYSTENGKVTVPLLRNDKRDDLIGVFRIIDRSANGTLVILWRELGRTSAPKINLPEEISEK